MTLMNSESTKPSVTPKGIAIIAAIESGLLPEVEGGWDDTAFQIFWERFNILLFENEFAIMRCTLAEMMEPQISENDDSDTVK